MNQKPAVKGHTIGPSVANNMKLKFIEIVKWILQYQYFGIVTVGALKDFSQADSPKLIIYTTTGGIFTQSTDNLTYLIVELGFFSLCWNEFSLARMHFGCEWTQASHQRTG